MNAPVSSKAMIQSGPLDFAQGTAVSAAEVKKFCLAVNNDAQKVSLGIVAALKKQGLQAQSKETSSGRWQVLVGAVSSEAGEYLHAEPNMAANITITANSGDVPATITALNAFFSNWRAVVGLIATGAAIVAGNWLMSVNRQPPQA
ncbi:MAG: hypothetical protein Q8R10_12690 [Pseudomonas sp.]|uniref:hypothetical protein n=1 Tax=Pseudomonas sp. TaxID=306 RepID=UPI002734E36E|nr:hypothetical protein [Pseudomonas sp.]MDP3847267.1 hypothetical protein [Pseudomonas sp.]